MIPDDVMDEAIKAGEVALRNLDQDDVSFEVEVIAHAILAERERIAKFCEESGYPDGHDIAYEIRNNKE